MAKFIDWQRFLDDTSSHIETSTSETCYTNVSSLIDLVAQSRNLIQTNAVEEYFKNVHLRRKCSKDDGKASKHREEGNVNFKKGAYMSAISSYNECIYWANDSEVEMSMGFANRSAALFHLKQYKVCLADMEVALSGSYPDNLRHKLHIRRTQAASYLGDTAMVETAVAASEQAMSTADIDTAVQRRCRKDLEACRSRVNAMTSRCHEDRDNDITVPDISHGWSETIPCASAALSLKCDEKRGRFLEACGSISAGDTLIVEQPYAAVLLPPCYATHCHHCIGTLGWVPVACRQCSEARYCGAPCRDAAWRAYHWLECGHLDMCHSIGIAHLSLRIVLTAGHAYLTSRDGLRADLVNTGGAPRGYAAVYRLLPHLTDMTPDDLHQYALTACLLLRCLDNGGFISDPAGSVDTGVEKSPVTSVDELNGTDSALDTDSELVAGVQKSALSSADELQGSDLIAGVEKLSLSPAYGLQGEIMSNGTDSVPDTDSGLAAGYELDHISNERLFVGLLLLRHICQLVCNAHAITAVRADDVTARDVTQSVQQERVATAVYPTVSLMNHACEPTVFPSFHKNTLVVRAVRPVARGQEVFNCYGPHAARTPTEERQQVLLQQYFFTCECRACREGAGLLGTFTCASCRGAIPRDSTEPACSSCSRPLDMTSLRARERDVTARVSRGRHLLDEGRADRAAAALTLCWHEAKGFLSADHRDMGVMADTLAHCYTILEDYKLALKFLKKSLAFTERAFGSFSVELARELIKMAGVAFEAREHSVSLATALRARKLLVLHYGEGHEAVRDVHDIVAANMTLLNT